VSPPSVVPRSERSQSHSAADRGAALRRAAAQRGQARTGRGALDPAAAREARMRILRREAELSDTQSAAVILGVPADASPELVEAAGARMVARYDAMRSDADLPPEGRELAARILRRVQEAHRRLQGRSHAEDQLSARFSSPIQTEEDQLLEGAWQRIELGRWAEALSMLRRARDLKLDHPGILCALGWATQHDARMAPAERDEETRGLLLLAVQFDPDHAQANLLLARFLEDRGEHASALRHARRAVRSAPEDTESLVLQRRLEQRVEGVDGKGKG